MKSLIFLGLMAWVGVAGAANNNKEELRDRLQLRVESFIVSADGTKVLERGSGTSVFSGIANDNGVYIAQADGFKDAYFSLQFGMNEDHTVRLEIAEWRTAKADLSEKDPKLSDLVRRENLKVKNFEPVSWIVKGPGEKNIVVRFTPLISEKVAAKLEYTPMAFSNSVITDNAGRVWGEGFGVGGQVAGLLTPHGSLYISYTEFAGSKEIGKAEGHAITVNATDKMVVRIFSEGPVVATGIVAKVYGVFLANKKKNRTVTSMSAASAEKAIKE